MDRYPNPPARSTERRTARLLLVAGLVLLVLPGCSLFVMAGKMLIGDSMMPAEFEQFTGKSLSADFKRTAVICTTPELIKAEFTSLDVDLLSEVSRRLRRSGVDTVPPHEVASWIDDRGGIIESLTELGEAVDTDYIIQIRIESFSYKEENSPNLLRGRSSGSVTVYEMQETKNGREARQIYAKEFSSIYPAHQPVSIDQMRANMFRKKYLDQVSEEIARLFCEHRLGDTF